MAQRAQTLLLLFSLLPPWIVVVVFVDDPLRHRRHPRCRCHPLYTRLGNRVGDFSASLDSHCLSTNKGCFLIVVPADGTIRSKDGKERTLLF
jgi:hypothetical protein